MLGVELLLPLPPFLRKGFRLLVRVEDVIEGAGMVTLRFADVVPAPANRSLEGTGEIMPSGTSVVSPIEGSEGLCGAS
jgi:hypothetical protein